MRIFFVDDLLNIIYKDKVFELKLKGTLEKGNVLKRTEFMEEFGKFLKKEKIKSKLFGDNIVIVKNAFYNNRDLYFLENIFLEMGFNKVIFLEIEKLLPDRKATFIEINNNYLILYLDKPILVDLEFIKDIPVVIKYFSTFFKNDIVLFGTNQYIPNIKISNLDIYYLENYNSYIKDSLLKVKKYDA